MTSDHREPILDSGAQAERTRLSWNRTGLALAVNAALLVHMGSGSLIAHIPALAMLAVAFGAFLFGNRRYRQINRAVRRRRSVVSMTHPRILAVIGILPAVIALAGLALTPG